MEDYQNNTCSKIFTEKPNLVRHIKNAHDKQQKHKCEVCEKDFSKLSNLRRHKESTHYRTSEVQCPKCNKILNRADNIKYYKCKQTAVLSVTKDFQLSLMKLQPLQLMHPQQTISLLMNHQLKKKIFQMLCGIRSTKGFGKRGIN